jgi:predicted GTPase
LLEERVSLPSLYEHLRKGLRTRSLLVNVKKVIILGAGGRDFHNFMVCFKDNPHYRVVAFTSTQIPGIERRVFPAELAGKLYKRGIPIYPEEELPKLIERLGVDEVIFSYSDVSWEHVMRMAAEVLSSGASLRLLSPHETMLRSRKPVIAVCATRTGAGKGTVARAVLRILKRRGFKAVVVRHPMVYAKRIEEQRCQRFEGFEDLKKWRLTIEEMEEYSPYLRMGLVVYAGVDYREILGQAEEEEVDLIVFEGGNNDTPLIRPSLLITVVDPLRPEGLFSYPGELNVRMADLMVINKCDLVSSNALKKVQQAIGKLNPRARVVKAKSTLRVDKPALLRSKKVLVVEDCPSVTHGSLGYGAGYVAARKYGARIVDPRPYLVGRLKQVFRKYGHLKEVLPSLGYTKEQLRDLESTIRRVDCDSVVLGTPCDLSKIIKMNKPVVRVTFELQGIGRPRLSEILTNFLGSI